MTVIGLGANFHSEYNCIENVFWIFHLVNMMVV